MPLRALLAWLLFSAPAAAQGVPLNGKNGPFQARLEQAFKRVQSYAHVNAAARFVDSRKETWCNSGAAALEGGFGTPGGVDTIFICSELQRWNLNQDQLFFVIAHELGHLKLHHTTLIDQKKKELLEPCTIMSKPQETKDCIADAVAPLRMEFEKAADAFALVLMARAGIDPRAQAEVLNRGADIDGPRTPYLDAVIRERTRAPLRIIIRPAPQFDR